MDPSSFPEYDNHEAVTVFHDKRSGLRAVIAIHSTRLGPAAGATRIWKYASEKDAIRDALRLSRGMTCKSALAGVPFGGGKGVIMAFPGMRRKKILQKYAAQVRQMRGNFYTGEDVGISLVDVKTMARVCPYIIGTKKYNDHPGFWTALGIFLTMERVAGEIYGTRSLSGRSVAVKGVGKVGGSLCALLAEAGVRLVIADKDAARAKRIAKQYRATIAHPDKIHRERVDVYAPCALAGALTKRTIRELRAGLVCGGANNQLETPEDGMRLMRAGIVYVPDYLVNAGGLISVVAELRKDGKRESWIRRTIEKIPATAVEIIRTAERQKRATSEIAGRMAQERIKAAR